MAGQPPRGLGFPPGMTPALGFPRAPAPPALGFPAARGPAGLPAHLMSTDALYQAAAAAAQQREAIKAGMAAARPPGGVGLPPAAYAQMQQRYAAAAAAGGGGAGPGAAAGAMGSAAIAAMLQAQAAAGGMRPPYPMGAYARPQFPGAAAAARPRPPARAAGGVSAIEAEALRRAEAAATAAAAAAAAARASGVLTLTEQAARVVMLLRDQPGRGGMTVGQLEAAAGFEVAANNDLMVSLTQNPKLAYEGAAGRFRYVSKYAAGDRYELLRLLRARGRDTGVDGAPELPGFPLDDLTDAFPGAERVLSELTRVGAELNVDPPLPQSGKGAAAGGGNSSAAAAGGKDAASLPALRPVGGVVRVRNVDTTKPDMLFARETPEDWGSLLPLSSMVPLSGTLTLTAGRMVAATTADLRSEVFRNDIIVIVGPSTAAPPNAASSSSSAAAAPAPKQTWSARCFRVHSGAIRGSLKLLLARARKDAQEKAAAVAAARRAAGIDSQQDDDDDDGDEGGDDVDEDEDGGDEDDVDGEEDDDGGDEEGAPGSGDAAATGSSGALMSQPPGAAAAAAAGAAPSSVISNSSAAAAAPRKCGRPPGSGKAARLAALAAQAVADGNVEAAAAVEMERRQWESDRATASVLAEHGILTVSVGNAVMNSGGHFSAGDTAPHVLRSTALGYAQPFTATALPLDRPWDGPSGSGYRAFKFGLTADLRVLWRETVAPGSLAKLAAYASGTSAAAAASTSTAPDGGDAAAAASEGGAGAGVAGGSGGAAASAAAAAASLITPHQTPFGSSDALFNVLASHAAFGGSGGVPLPSGGGGGGFSSSRSFPVDHRELRTELAKLGLDRVCPMEPGTLAAGPGGLPTAAGAKAGRATKRRRPDRRAFEIQSNLHVFEGPHGNEAVALAVKKARLEVLRDDYEARKH